MQDGVRFDRGSAEPRAPTPAGDDAPTVSVCEGAPGTSVFLEDGCTDGWISTDTTVDVER
jgi:hypothetical protein